MPATHVFLLPCSAQNKSRLKWSVFAHYVAFALLAFKLSPEILDRFGVFVLELEELYIPKVGSVNP